jgi:UTP--glucose-1-phosphate uridylyltransferase
VNQITDAVIPVGGLGTRLLPATRSQPKEMLPVVDRPVVQYVVEELVRAGIGRVLFVTGRRKRAIEDHFDADPELGSGPLIDPRTGLQILYTRQAHPAGLGDAVRYGESLGAGAGVVVALGDTIIEGPAHSGPGVVARLIEAFGAGGVSAAVAVEEVPAEAVSRYGIVVAGAGGDAAGAAGGGAAGGDAGGTGGDAAGTGGDAGGTGGDAGGTGGVAGRGAAGGGALGGGVLEVTDVVEKPDPASVSSRLAIAARYVLGPSVFAALRSLMPDRSGEVQLTDALRAVIARGERVVAVPLAAGERRHDIGTVAGYCAVFLEYALTDPRFGSALRARAAALLDGDG